MVNSGTEAVMSAIRTARGYTGRAKIVKFMGCYHGHSDALLVQAGSGVMTAGIPDSAGVPAGCTKDTLSAVYNDLSSVETLFEEFPKEIAAVIVEPVAANMGLVPPKADFWKGCAASARNMERCSFLMKSSQASVSASRVHRAISMSMRIS